VNETSESESNVEKSPQQNPSFARTAADKVGIGKSQSLFTLVLVSTLASSFIAAYVLIVGLFTIHRLEVDTIGDAAVQAAREISDIQVEDPSTGTINLCDWRDRISMYRAEKASARSIFSLRKTFEKLEELGRLSKIDLFVKMAQRDKKKVEILESKLADAVRAAVKQQSSAHDGQISSEGQGRVYEHIKSLLMSNLSPQEGGLSRLQIKLGYVDANEFNTQGLPVTIVSSKSFAEVAPHKAPNLVLVTAEFRTKQKDGQSAPEVVTKTACAFIKPQSDNSYRCLFALTFPQGMPPNARNVFSMIKTISWKSKGTWRQVIGNEVPGNGSLAPPLEPSLPEMSPADALCVALYDWLKYVGPDFQPETVMACFKQNWETGAQINSSNLEGKASSFGVTDDQINSCVARDTGARDYAFLYQSNPNGVGQIALSKAFQITQLNALPQANHNFPANSFPLFINSTGHCTIVGTKSFDKVLLHNFFKDLKATNLAALESFSAAKSLHEQSVNALYQLSQRQMIEQQELASLKHRLVNISRTVFVSIDNRAEIKAMQESADEKKRALEKELIEKRMVELKEVIDEDEKERLYNVNLQHRTSVVAQNANRIQTSTYELCANLSTFCRDGLFAITPGGYLVGQNTIFIPLTKPILEADLLESVDSDKGKQIEPKEKPLRSQIIQEANNPVVPPYDLSVENPLQPGEDSNKLIMSWLKPDLQVFLTAENAFSKLQNVRVGNKSLQAKITAGSVLPKVTSCMLLFDSLNLNKDEPSKVTPPRLTGSYPFSNLAVPVNQMIYYCGKAMATGQTPSVNWSVLARNFVACQGNVVKNNSTTEYVGAPVSANNAQFSRSWAAAANNENPPLAGEFQIRTPLPDFANEFEETYLTNPLNDSQTAEIPPVPPDML
jgi:hypothetical protein